MRFTVQILGPATPVPTMVVDFTSDIVQVEQGQPVQFQPNNSFANAIEHLWDFGDDTYSREETPVKTYTKDGLYTVKYMAAVTNNQGGIEIKTNYITVESLNNFSTFFDGVNDFLSGSYSGILGQDQRYFSFWFKNNQSVVQEILSYGSTGAGASFQVRLDPGSGAGRLTLFCRGASISWDTPNLNDNEWHHVGISVPQTAQLKNCILFFDGALADVFGTISGGTSINTGSTNPVNIARNAFGDAIASFTGNLDEISLWAKNFTFEENEEIYNNGRPNNLALNPNFALLQAWWRMGDGDNFPIISDVSGNDRHLTMNNMSAENFEEDVPQ